MKKIYYVYNKTVEKKTDTTSSKALNGRFAIDQSLCDQIGLDTESFDCISRYRLRLKSRRISY